MTLFKKLITLAVALSFIALASCGTFGVKPEATFTKHSENLDYKVVFLDSLGLVFLIVPGVIALTVDYVTGTIYLTDEENLKQRKGVDPKDVRDLIASNYPEISSKKLDEITAKLANLQHHYN